jgi:hypothetical protein
MRRVLITCGSPVTYALLLIFFVLLLVMIFGGCTTLRLEAKLDKSVRDWYDTHRVIMDQPLPYGQKITELQYFLTLPLDLQKKYIGFFWKMRDSQARGWFESRLWWIERTHLNLKLDEAARVILVNGLPDDIYIYDEYGIEHQSSGLLDYQGYYECVVIWRYYMPNGQYADYGFEYKGGRWEAYPLGVGPLSDTRKLETWSLDFFAVTMLGWDDWQEAIK